VQNSVWTLRRAYYGHLSLRRTLDLLLLDRLLLLVVLVSGELLLGFETPSPLEELLDLAFFFVKKFLMVAP